MKKISIQAKTIALILLITIGAKSTQLKEDPGKTIYEEIRYNQNLKSKKDSVESFDISAAINISLADPNTLQFLTNWGDVRKGEIDPPIISLSQDYIGATTLLTDADNGFLNIVAFHRQNRKCLITMVYEEFKGESLYKRELTFTDLTRSECARVRISRYGDYLNESKGRLISYISDKGVFRWIARRVPDEDNKEWKCDDDVSLFGEVLDPSEYHQVKVLASNSTDPDFFFVYQKSGGKNSQENIGKLAYFYSNANPGHTNSTSTLKFKRAENLDFFKLSNVAPDYFELVNVNLESGIKKGELSGYWLSFKYISNGSPYNVYGYLDTAKIFRNEEQKQVSYSNFFDEKRFEGTVNFIRKEGDSRESINYYSLLDNGKLVLCNPKRESYVVNYRSEWEYNCLYKTIAGNSFNEDELIDSLNVYPGPLAIVTMRKKSDQQVIRNMVFDLGKNQKKHDFDFESNLYLTNESGIFEIPREMKIPRIRVMSENKDKSRYYLLPGSVKQPEDPLVIASNGGVIVTHHFKLGYVENFVEEYVEFNEFYLRVKESEKGKVITSGDFIKVKADYIKSYDLQFPSEFFFVTPFILLGNSEALGAKKTEYLVLKESINIKTETPTEENYPILCELENYYLFSQKDTPNQLSHFTPKNENIPENMRYMVLKLKPKALPAKDFKCFSNDSEGLFIGRGENKNIYSIAAFRNTGEYFIREFYSEKDLLGATSIKFNTFSSSYTISFNEGAETGVLDFEKLYPLYRANGSTLAVVKVEGLKNELKVDVSYEDKKKKSIVVE